MSKNAVRAIAVAMCLLLGPAQAQRAGSGGGHVGMTTAVLTLGNQDHSTTSTWGGGALGYESAVTFVCPGTGIVTAISLYMVNGVGNIVLTVWDAGGSGGAPGNLIAYTASTAAISNSWNSIAVVTPAPVIYGQTYYVGFANDNGAITFGAATGGSIVGYYNTAGTMTYASPPATPFPAATSYVGGVPAEYAIVVAVD